MCSLFFVNAARPEPATRQRAGLCWDLSPAAASSTRFSGCGCGDSVVVIYPLQPALIGKDTAQEPRQLPRVVARRAPLQVIKGGRYARNGTPVERVVRWQ